MQERNPVIRKARAKKIFDLRRECDLGDQHQALPTLRMRRGDQAQIEFGFAAACCAVQKVHAEMLECRQHRVEHLLLFRGSLG